MSEKADWHWRLLPTFVSAIVVNHKNCKIAKPNFFSIPRTVKLITILRVEQCLRNARQEAFGLLKVFNKVGFLVNINLIEFELNLVLFLFLVQKIPFADGARARSREFSRCALHSLSPRLPHKSLTDSKPTRSCTAIENSWNSR